MSGSNALLLTRVPPIVYVLMAALSFGVYPSAAKIAYNHGVSQSFVMIATTFARMAVFWLIAVRAGYRFREIFKPGRGVLMAGFSQGVSVLGIFLSLVYVPAAIMITLVFSYSIMLILFKVYRGEIGDSAVALIVAALALLGISLVVGLFGKLGEINLVGVSFALLAAIFTAVRFYCLENELNALPSSLVGVRVFGSALLFVSFVVLWQPISLPFDFSGLAALLSACASLAIGSVAVFHAISLMGSYKVSLFMKTEPVCTAIVAFLVLGERLEILQYFGIAVVLFSLIFFHVHTARSLDLRQGE